MYIVLKGKLGNFLYSLKDMKKRETQLIKKFPEGTFIWGTNRRISSLEKGVKVLFYLTGEGIESGIVFYGEILSVGELKEKYWPEGEWKYWIAIKVEKMPKSIIEYDDPSKWHYVTYEELKSLGFRPLPWPQKIEDELAKKIISMLEKK
ncbi:hypothetical protein SJAV_09280 [Sulfurisphaera javensis]|uniref:EVE domain-containing protein n=1 Tax=Sulfurisphaera javensis TaxID=2049879 RepID=A0AAT9GQL4_9CREN